jgi:predicted O-methyltransferase YrrM
MALKSTSAFGRWQKAAWPVARLFVRPRTRWFVEGHPKLDGQLWVADRRLLYETVRSRAPVNCFEIGTWKGGGSTLFIAQALHANGRGVLHTIEVDRALGADARRAYKSYLPHLLPHVDFHLGDYRQEYRNASRADFVFLDGAEDARETLAQYEFFLPRLHTRAVLVVHDWLTDKARLVRDLLEQSRDWRIERVLLPPRSVGCALAVRIS